LQLLEGKIALVTGSSRGLGRAIALRLAAAGADVVVHDRNEQAAAEFGESTHPEETVAAVRRLGRRSLFVQGDVGDAAAVGAFTRAALDAFERIDILVNCAGGDIAAAGGKPEPNDCLQIPDEDVQAILDRNLLGTMHCCRAVAPGMIARGAGKIVNIASVAGEVGVAYGSIYAVAKAAIIHYTRCLAAQLRGAGVNVNCISPGAIRTARFLATRSLPPERLQDTGRLTRLGEPDDIAGVALFLCSDMADYVHGQTIRVDGGARL
jgi:NAD(P)-dependent dehydrogenase (short-subunit alcohol dehydrogenase family)